MSESSSSFSTSPSLIEQVKAADADAWGKLSYIYTPLVFGWVRRSGIQEADISDIVQEVFSRVLKSIGRFEHSSFRGWLLTITRNEIRRLYRHRQSRVPGATGGSAAMAQMKNLPDTDTLLPDGIENEQDARKGIVRRAAEMIRNDFEPHTWQAFWRSVAEGHDTADIAADLDMKPGAIRQAKFRILARLRETLGDELAAVASGPSEP